MPTCSFFTCRHGRRKREGQGGNDPTTPNFADTYRKENISRYRNRQYISCVPSHFWTLPPPLIQLFYLPLLFSSWVCREIFLIVIFSQKTHCKLYQILWDYKTPICLPTLIVKRLLVLREFDYKTSILENLDYKTPILACFDYKTNIFFAKNVLKYQ